VLLNIFPDLVAHSRQAAIWGYIRSASKLNVWKWKRVDMAFKPSEQDGIILLEYLYKGEAVVEEESAIRNGYDQPQFSFALLICNYDRQKYKNRYVRLDVAAPPKAQSEFKDTLWSLDYRKGNNPSIVSYRNSIHRRNKSFENNHTWKDYLIPPTKPEHTHVAINTISLSNSNCIPYMCSYVICYNQSDSK
jgi:hypothetical protein